MKDAVAFRVGRVSFPQDVVVQVIGGEALVLNLRAETVFSLNPTGARIAQLIQSGLTLDAVVDALCPEYGVDRTEILPDVNELVEMLLRRGLVVPAPGEVAR
jgi:hypothetical protein